MSLSGERKFVILLVVLAIVAVLLSFIAYAIIAYESNEGSRLAGGYVEPNPHAYNNPSPGKLPAGQKDMYQVDKRLFWIIVSVAFSSVFIASFLAYNIIIRVRAESELKDSSERYMKAFSLSPEAMIVHSHGRIIMANKAAAEIAGVEDPERLKGGRTQLFVKVKRRRKLVMGNKNDRDCPVYEYEISRNDGKTITVLSTTVSFPFKGQNMKLSVLKDMTAHYMLREAVELDKLKSRFFANLSHEIRTPLNVIMSTVQLLKFYAKKSPEKIEPGVVTKKIDIINMNCYRLLRLVNNLIDITRLDTGNYELNLENRDIVGIVRNITLSAAKLAEQNDVKLIFHTDLKEKIIACDQQVLERIILNLLSNAVKFSLGNCVVCVSLYSAGNKVKISVSDNGIGIPEYIKENVFEKFFHVDESFTRQAEGSGIGLSLVKSLVEMHGGRITINSSEGEGSEFIISLPDVKVAGQNATVNTNTGTNTDTDTVDYLEKVCIEFSDVFHTIRK